MWDNYPADLKSELRGDSVGAVATEQLGDTVSPVAAPVTSADPLSPKQHEPILSAQPQSVQWTYHPRVVASTLAMFLQSFKRAWIQHSRSKKSFFVDNLLVFVASMFLSIISYGAPMFRAPQPIEVR